MSGKTLMWLVSLGIVKPKIVNRVIILQRDSKEVEKAIETSQLSQQRVLYHRAYAPPQILAK